MKSIKLLEKEELQGDNFFSQLSGLFAFPDA
jgi:hypothetical protein